MATQELLIRLGVDDSNFSTKMKSISKEMQVFESKIKANQAVMDNLFNDKASMAVKQKALIENIAELTKQLSAQSVRYEEAQKAVKEYSSKIAEAEKDIKEYNSALKAGGQVLDEEKYNLKALGQEMTALGSSVDKLEKEYQEMAQDVNKADVELKQYEQTLNATKSMMASQSTSIEKAELAYSKLGQSFNSLGDKIGVLGGKLFELKRKMTEQQTAIDTNKAKMKSLEQEITALNNEYKANSQRFGENSKQCKNLQASITELTSKYNNLENENKQLTQSLKLMSDEYKNTENSMKEATASMKKIETAMDTLKTKSKEAQAEYNRLKTVLKEQATEYKKLETNVINAKNARDKALTALEKERAKLQEVGANYEKTSIRIKELTNEYNGYCAKLDRATKAHQTYNRQLQQAQIEMNQAKQKMVELNALIKEQSALYQNSNIDRIATNFSRLGNTLTGLGKTMTSVGTTMTATISTPLAMIGTKALTTFSDFEQQIRRVNAVMSNDGFASGAEGMAQKFDQLSENSRKFAMQTEWTATEVGQSYQYMAMAGWNLSESTEAMLPMLNLASIGMVELSTASDIVTDTMTPFANDLEKVAKEAKKTGKEINTAEYTVDLFAQTIASSNTNVELLGETMKYSSGSVAGLGISLKDTMVAVGLMANASIKGSMAGTSLAMGLKRLVAPTDNVKAEMKKYGIELQKNKDGSVNLQKTMEVLRNKLGKLETTTRASAVATIFGATAQKGWLAIINASQDDFNRLTKAMDNSTGASARMMEEMKKSGAYTFKILQSNIQELLITLGDALAPAMLSFAETITKATQKISEWVNRMQESNPELLEFIGKIAILAVVIPPVLMAFGAMTTGLGNISTGISKTLKGISKFRTTAKAMEVNVKSLSGFSTVLAEVAGVSLPVALGVAVVALVGVMTAVGQNESALQWLIDKWGVLGEAVALACEHISGVVKASLGTVLILISGVAKAIGALLKGKLWEIDDIITETTAKVQQNVVRASADMAGESTRALKSMKKDSVEELRQMQDAFNTAMDVMKNGSVDTAGEVAKGLANIFTGMDDKLISQMRGVSDIMTSLLININKDMSMEEVTKALETNYKDLMKTGKYTASEIEAEFTKAKELITSSMADGVKQITQVGNDAVKIIQGSSSSGVQQTASDLAKWWRSLEQSQREALANMGGNWTSMFGDMTDITNKTGDEMKNSFVDKINQLNLTSSTKIEEFKNELTDGITQAKNNGIANLSELNTTAGIKYSELKGIAKNIATLNKDTVQNISSNLSNSLSKMSAESILDLQKNSNSWGLILKGVSANADFTSQETRDAILNNMQQLVDYTPEKLQQYSNNLTVGLTDAQNRLKQASLENLQVLSDSAKYIAGVNKSNLEQISGNLSANIMSLSATTIADLQQNSDSWAQLLNGIKSDTDLSTQNITQTIKNNLQQMLNNTPAQMRTFASHLQIGASDAKNRVNGETQQMTSDVKSNVDNMVSSVNSQFSQVDASLITSDANAVNSALSSIAGQSLGSTVSQVNNLNTSTKDADKSTTELNKSQEKLNNQSTSKLTGEVGTTKSKTDELISSAQTAIDKFNSLAGISLYNVRNEVYKTNSALQDLAGSAKVANRAVGQVSGFSLFDLSEDNPVLETARAIPETLTLATISTYGAINAGLAGVATTLSNMKTSGGYYNQNTSKMSSNASNQQASLTAQVNELKRSNKIQSDTLETMKELLVTLVKGQQISLQVDGRQIAMASASYMENQINIINKRKNRLGGAY